MPVTVELEGSTIPGAITFIECDGFKQSAILELPCGPATLVPGEVFKRTCVHGNVTYIEIANAELPAPSLLALFGALFKTLRKRPNEGPPNGEVPKSARRRSRKRS
jgi:hypothetical protein